MALVDSTFTKGSYATGSRTGETAEREDRSQDKCPACQRKVEHWDQSSRGEVPEQTPRHSERKEGSH